MMASRRFDMIISAAIFLLSLKAWGIEQRAQLETATGTLHGTFDLPNGTAPCPVVVIIAGSGPTDRDGNQALMKNDSLKLLGQALATRGIAALRYDKRGIAESAAAAPREEDLRFEAYAADVAQWVSWLRQHPRFLRVALIGHSEGSLIGMLAAKQTKVDAFEVPVLVVQGTADLQISVDDAKKLAAAKKGAQLRLIDGMNHVLKHATLPAEQRAAYTDPSLPIKSEAVEEIIAFLGIEIASAAQRPNQAIETDAKLRRGSSPGR